MPIGAWDLQVLLGVLVKLVMSAYLNVSSLGFFFSKPHALKDCDLFVVISCWKKGNGVVGRMLWFGISICMLMLLCN